MLQTKCAIGDGPHAHVSVLRRVRAMVHPEKNSQRIMNHDSLQVTEVSFVTLLLHPDLYVPTAECLGRAPWNSEHCLVSPPSKLRTVSLTIQNAIHTPGQRRS